MMSRCWCLCVGVYSKRNGFFRAWDFAKFFRNTFFARWCENFAVFAHDRALISKKSTDCEKSNQLIDLVSWTKGERTVLEENFFGWSVDDGFKRKGPPRLGLSLLLWSFCDLLSEFLWVFLSLAGVQQRGWIKSEKERARVGYSPSSLSLKWPTHSQIMQTVVGFC